MKYTEKEVLQFVEENDVKFVKLMFCDIFGSLKTISVIAGELPKIFREGLIFDASKLGGFLNVTASDLRLFPDPDTLALLPWRPQHGRVQTQRKTAGGRCGMKKARRFKGNRGVPTKNTR